MEQRLQERVRPQRVLEAAALNEGHVLVLWGRKHLCDSWNQRPFRSNQMMNCTSKKETPQAGNAFFDRERGIALSVQPQSKKESVLSNCLLEPQGHRYLLLMQLNKISAAHLPHPPCGEVQVLVPVIRRGARRHPGPQPASLSHSAAGLDLGWGEPLRARHKPTDTRSTRESGQKPRTDAHSGQRARGSGRGRATWTKKQLRKAQTQRSGRRREQHKPHSRC